MGSSPPARGKHLVERTPPYRQGLIPAHAEKTQPFDASSYQPRAHPRSRGENTAFRLPAASASGSSPLTRGKHIADCAKLHLNGLIPAHAGKTPRRGARRRYRGAHPRSRGKNYERRRSVRGRSGSSPLTREKLDPQSDQRDAHGLIPAHAGKTSSQSVGVLASPDHPRSRGENTSRMTPVRAFAGSSPLTRGKHVDCEQIPRLQGLIPAHAGKTVLLVGGHSPAGAHPRSRGENRSGGRRRRPRWGSSPLTRGKHVEEHRDDIGVGLIPAHAGKTPNLALPR